MHAHCMDRKGTEYGLEVRLLAREMLDTCMYHIDASQHSHCIAVSIPIPRCPSTLFHFIAA